MAIIFEAGFPILSIQTAETYSFQFNITGIVDPVYYSAVVIPSTSAAPSMASKAAFLGHADAVATWDAMISSDGLHTNESYFAEHAQFEKGTSYVIYMAISDTDVVTAESVLGTSTAYKYLGTPLMLEIDTSLPGSANNVFSLPMNEQYVYDFTINWGDGQTEIVTRSIPDHEVTFYIPLTHNYAIPGVYIIKITENVLNGFPAIKFEGELGDDRAKLLRIVQWGTSVTWQTFRYAFFDCINMTINDSGYDANTGSVTNFEGAWSGCSSITNFPSDLDLSGGTNFIDTWAGCSSMVSFPGTLNLSNGVDFTNAWQFCSSLTGFPKLNLSSGIDFSNAWFNCNVMTSFPWEIIPAGAVVDNAWVGTQVTRPAPGTFMVFFNSNGGSAVATTYGVVSGNKISSPPAPTKSYVVFDGWYSNVGLTTVWNFSSNGVTETITLYAKWRVPDAVTLPISKELGGTVSLESNNVIMNFAADSFEEQFLEITIVEDRTAVTAGYVRASSVYDFIPDGKVFLKPVQVAFKFDPLSVTYPAIYWSTDVPGVYENIGGAVSVNGNETYITANVTHFSSGFVGEIADQPNKVVVMVGRKRKPITKLQNLRKTGRYGLR